ncbi:MAG: class I SAM-dependent methyltransferase [Nitrosopumilaceae archaeon]|nr:class I SAM-dependent methyltransferase [Nitrosopumilaceae archaeon]
MDKQSSYVDNHYIFNTWAKNGQSEYMEIEHKKTTIKFLQKIKFNEHFTFLDIGCGNGWLLREISKSRNCKNSIGIDNSHNMIQNALNKKKSTKENYVVGDILTYDFRMKFDYIFSIESLYYIVPMEKILHIVYELLKPHGVFFCGTDFYSENSESINWPVKMNLNMDLRSKNEWYKMFRNIGFKTQIKQVTDEFDPTEWRREIGTLFIIGKK